MARKPLERTDKGIKDRLFDIFEEMVEVRVVTAVGNAEVTLTQEEPNGPVKTGIVTGEQKQLTDALVTIFDLVDGDVTNVIAPSLRDDAELRAFHSDQVEKSMKVLPDNVRALVELGKAIINEI
jgi:hypothetical protein